MGRTVDGCTWGPRPRRWWVTGALVMGVATPVSAAGPELAPPRDPVGAYEYDAAPATLFVPIDAIALVPADLCPVPGNTSGNSALGCVDGLDEATDYVPRADQAAIVEALRTALAPYAVRVTTERPPPYVPYTMLLPGDAIDLEATSRTCVVASIDCDGVKRNDTASTGGGTANCTDPDPVQAALIAFGYLSGLENNDNPADPMFYPPEFDAPSTAYVDACASLVPSLDEEGMVNLPVCVGLYHEVHCDDLEGTINGDRELRGVYGSGPLAEDTTPPVVEGIGLAGDLEVASGTRLPFWATLTDDGGYVFVRWSVTGDNPDLLDVDFDGDGVVCKGHNDVCEVGFDDALPPYYQDADGSYGAAEISTLPDGTYEVTFEAADLAGNAIDPITVSIVVGGGVDTGPSDDTGPLDGTRGDGDGGTLPPADSGPADEGPAEDEAANDGGVLDDEGGGATGSSGTGGAAQDLASRGCSCDAGGATISLGWVMLMGLGMQRRR